MTLFAQYENPQFYDAKNIIVILGIVPQGITFLVNALIMNEKKQLWGIPYWQGKLHGKSVVIAITGIGKTFTGMTSTLFIKEFQPRLVLMAGTGARINQQLRTGDIIVATHSYEHDYGSLTADNEMVYRPMNSPNDGKEVINEFKTSATMLALTQKAIECYPPQTIIIDDSISYENIVRFGIVASSDLFGVPQVRIDFLRNHFRTDIMEIESGPLSLVCQTFGVPYLIVRSGSNIAQEAPNNDYLRLSPIAAREAAKFLLHLIKFLD
jgi:5'-methylthioadenosine/S-adenosylhomocysteine nucleosidase